MKHPSRLLVLVMLVSTVGVVWPSQAAAQRAVPRGRITGVAVPRTYGSGYYRPYYYYPRYYYPRYYYPYYPSFAFSIGFGWPYWGPYGYPYGYSYGYPYAYPYAYGYPYWYDNTGSARLQITPRNAQVYVDGRFVGLVDDFDGSFQRLNVEIGHHEIQVYQEGYRTLKQKVLFTRGTTVKIEGALQPLAPGEAAEPIPAPVSRRSAEGSKPDATAERYQSPRPTPPPRPGEASEFGTLLIRVNPSDAVILIDGEVWERPEGESRFSIDLTDGPHQVEIRKEGYRPYVRTVDIRRGRPFTLNVSLTPGGSRA